MLAPEFYAVALDDSPYFRFYDRSPVTRLLRATIPDYLRPGASVLDLGCGNAIAACHIAASNGRGTTYLGIDPDPAACEWGRRVLAALPADRVTGRIAEQSLHEYLAGSAGARFDLVLSSWSFRACVDVARPETHDPMAAAIGALVAPRGALLVGDACIAPGAAEDELERIRRYHARVAGAHGAGRPVFPPELIDVLFRRAGLERVARHEVPAVPLAEFLGMPHDRYCLQAFRRPRDGAARP